MSAMTSTFPALLKKPTFPSADTSDVTALGVAPCSATQLTLDASGRVALAGKTVRYEASFGFAAVTFIATPVASSGIVHWPLVPRMLMVWVFCAVSGVERVLTLSDAKQI